MSDRDETKVDQEQVHDEHLRSVHVGAHWVYLFGVIVGGLALMLVLIAILGQRAG